LWPERLLHIANVIRGLVSGALIADFFRLAQLSEPQGLGEVEEYDGQYKHVLKALLEASLMLLEVADRLSIPWGSSLRVKIEAARNSAQEAASLVDSARPLHLLLRPLPSEAASLAASNLPSYDFVPLARAAALGAAVSRLCVALEAGEQERSEEHLKTVPTLASEFVRLWEWRTPENLGTPELSMIDLFRREFMASPDLEVGLTLSTLRCGRRIDKPRYLRELVKLIHAAIEEARGPEAEVDLSALYALLSGATLFLDIGMNDVMICLTDLKDRGWIEGIEEKGGRQTLVLRQPNIEHLISRLRAQFGGAAVTTRRAVEVLGWDYFTALHVIKHLERSGELEPDENGTDGCAWRWRNGTVSVS